MNAIAVSSLSEGGTDPIPPPHNRMLWSIFVFNVALSSP
jgi:hypothetical protein